MKEMRRKDRQLSTAEAQEILVRGEYGILSTVGADGCPYAIPVSYAYENDTIYFHCAKGTGLKVENMSHQPKVCFTVVGNTEVLPEKFSTKYESAVVFGTAREADDKRIGLTLLQEKYSPDFAELGKQHIESSFDHVEVYEIHAEQVTGKGRR